MYVEQDQKFQADDHRHEVLMQLEAIIFALSISAAPIGILNSKSIFS